MGGRLDLAGIIGLAVGVGTGVGAAIVYVKKELFPIKNELQTKDSSGKPTSNGHTMREGMDTMHEKVDKALRILEGQSEDLEKLDTRLLLTEKRVSVMFDQQGEAIDAINTRLERMESLQSRGGNDGEGSR